MPKERTPGSPEDLTGDIARMVLSVCRTESLRTLTRKKLVQQLKTLGGFERSLKNIATVNSLLPKTEEGRKAEAQLEHLQHVLLACARPDTAGKVWRYLCLLNNADPGSTSIALNYAVLPDSTQKN